MPAQYPSASFVPIPPDLNLDQLVASTPNFEYVVRISWEMVKQQGQASFDKLILLHVIMGGKPLVIEGFEKCLPKWLFSPAWLQDNEGDTLTKARDLSRHEDLTLTIGHYINHMAKLTNQWDNFNYAEADRQRLYLKDIDCPDQWHRELKDLIPASVFYLNESTGDIDGPGAIKDDDGILPPGKGAAPAGDLMSSLPPPMRAENMMCYIGHEGTYTPAHREMCATLGHNIMVETSGSELVNGKREKPGSSIWFMTESKDRHLVSEYWLSTLGHDIEIESHFAQINAWMNAPFTTYVVEQKVGDFIIIPPLAPHQVWNRGTRTMKAAWNRTTIETLVLAFDEALPRARMVCRDEQYKNKAIVYYTLIKYSELLARVSLNPEDGWNSQAVNSVNQNRKVRQLRKDFRRLWLLYNDIILSESFSPGSTERGIEYLKYDSNVTCSYCRCNIFNRFLTCTTCIHMQDDGDEDTYDVCMECFVMGRSCGCISKFKWVEQFRWDDLVTKHEQWRKTIVELEPLVSLDATLHPLSESVKHVKKKTLAQICQEQLKLRPWRDITKPIPKEQPQEEDDSEVQVDEEGRAKKKKGKRRSERWLRENLNCHICKHREEKWKLAHCKCGVAYCYGSLWRAFDIMPQKIMEDLDWKCPRCLKICSCGACRKDEKMIPYEPKGTLLGHDTKKVADPRSVESLVDFSRSNLTWLKPSNDDLPFETARLRRKREEAEQAKARQEELNEEYVDPDEYEAMDSQETPRSEQDSYQTNRASAGEMPLDPRLSIGNTLPENILSDDNNQIPSEKDGQVSAANKSNESYISPPSSHLSRVAAQTSAKALSLLERNPEQFMAAAGLTLGSEDQDFSHPPPMEHVSPGSTLLRRDIPSTTSNNQNTILYNDPETGLPVGGVHQTSYPRLEASEAPKSTRQKRKRQEERSEDVNDSLTSEANFDVQKTQRQTRLQNAKKNDAAKVRLADKNPLFKRPVKKNLSGLTQDKFSGAEQEYQESLLGSSLGGDGTADVDDRIIVRSNLSAFVKNQTAAMDVIKTPPTTTRPRRPRKSGTPTELLPAKKSKTKAHFEPSDGDEDMLYTPAKASATPESANKGRRSAWLERKNRDEPADIPTELPRTRRPRRSRLTQESIPPPSDDTVNNNHSDPISIVPHVVSEDMNGASATTPEESPRRGGTSRKTKLKNPLFVSDNESEGSQESQDSYVEVDNNYEPLPSYRKKMRLSTPPPKNPPFNSTSSEVQESPASQAMREAKELALRIAEGTGSNEEEEEEEEEEVEYEAHLRKYASSLKEPARLSSQATNGSTIPLKKKSVLLGPMSARLKRAQKSKVRAST
ncbi:MAG: hypothetical protein M1829_004349 [Trizodia sp. TS-e1964]|nr:MAG: hypothetical protein M1829_004349 [Trizodia sp. TS-e1964]